jgi:hypothetical protein
MVGGAFGIIPIQKSRPSVIARAAFLWLFLVRYRDANLSNPAKGILPNPTEDIFLPKFFFNLQAMSSYKILSPGISQTSAEAIVCFVKSDGQVGNSVSESLRQLFPISFELYQRQCRSGSIAPGRVLSSMDSSHQLLFVPIDSFNPAKMNLEQVRTGMEVIVRGVNRCGIKSLAMPLLGGSHQFLSIAGEAAKKMHCAEIWIYREPLIEEAPVLFHPPTRLACC